ncbi:MAG: alpha/beta fold hydrolase [Planctomycetota bacterium]
MPDGWLTMDDLPERFRMLPGSLRDKTRATTLGSGVPALLIHPTWESPAPWVFWMHGRTVSKELDPGRYLRWVRAGIGCCAIDLPGHGERYDAERTHPRASPSVIEQATGEIDGVIEDVLHGDWGPVFDPDRIGIGGMSLGGMVTLRRLCEPHPFKAAVLESTSGDLGRLYSGEDLPDDQKWPVDHAPEVTARIDPSEHLDGFRPIPVLAMHSEADVVVPWNTQRGFLDRLAARYEQQGADAGLIQRLTWPQTGAPSEHAGFGKVANDAKTAHTEFFERTLLNTAGADGGADR